MARGWLGESQIKLEAVIARLTAESDISRHELNSQQLTDDGSSLRFVLNDARATDTAVTGEERRKVDRSLTSICEGANTHALCFKVLHCPGNVKKTLASRADDSHGGSAQLRKIG